MPSNLQPEIRSLPLYIDGVAHGTDIGLAIALAVITSERAYQERLTAGPQACRVYADGALSSVARVLARRFREETR
jgi:hypothetical protein